MALDLHIAGPGLDATRRLLPGEPVLVLGRDADCAVCLPDPERNVSRTHLSVWNEGGQLHFQVLSAINGVELSQQAVPPGARGILPPGALLRLSAFRLVVRTVPDAPDADPWSEFERQAAAIADAMPPASPAAATREGDPFGDWGLFGDTFAPQASGGALHADGLAPATDLRPFAAGLGLDPQRLAALTQGELEAIGRLTRIALGGLLQAAQAADQARQAWSAADGASTPAPAANPLRSDMPAEARLQYLLGGRAGAGHAMPPDQAVADVVHGLLAHQQALGEAVPVALEAVLREFDPEALKARLLPGGPRLFEAARAWEAFVRDHARQAGDAQPRVRQWLERHVAAAYESALMRAKRDTGQRRR